MIPSRTTALSLTTPPPVLSHVRTVLVAPRTSENVAASARACDAFECFDLRIVSPRCPLKSERVDQVSRQARSLEGAKIHDTLAEALVGAQVAVAFTRRAGGYRPTLHRADAYDGLLPWRRLEGRREEQTTLALVFGREESGLTDEEVQSCTHGCYLPTGRAQASLNLSHAVCLALSDEFRHARKTIKESTQNTPLESQQNQWDVAKISRPFGRETWHRRAELQQKDAFMERIRQAIHDTEGAAYEDQRRIRHLEKVLKRSDVTVQELQAMHGILSCILKNKD